MEARIEDDFSTKKKYFETVNSKFKKLTLLRDEVAKKHGKIPAMFLNDGVLMHVFDKCPKNITELWGVDGISDEFVMNYGDDFMERLIAKLGTGYGARGKLRIRPIAKPPTHPPPVSGGLVNHPKPMKEQSLMQGEKWSKEHDIWFLENMNKDVHFIMKHFQRNRGSITSRMKHILNENHNAHKRLKEHYGEMSFHNKIESLQMKSILCKMTPKSMKEQSLKHTHLDDKNANALRKNLTSYRTKMAQEGELPPYCIYHNSVIDEIVARLPENDSELLNIKGFGKVKVEKYGGDIVQMCVEANKQEILSHFREGKSIEEIAECRKVSKHTIEKHLLSIMETEDVDIDPDYFGLTQEYEDEIKEVIGRIGSETLSSIKERVNSNISYTQIKLCMLIIRIEGEQ